MTPSTILLVRHAQSTWNAAGLWQGQADPPLSPEGLHQAARLATEPQLEGIDLLLSSDLQRARQTAQAISFAYALPVTELVELREVDVGSWSGRTRDAIEATEPGAMERYAAYGGGWIGGETKEQHARRCEAAADYLMGLECERPAVVTHGGTMRMLVVALLGLDDADWSRFAGSRHATITELRRRNHGWQLVTYGA
jgi:broad specificity phosphatase PhoE